MLIGPARQRCYPQMSTLSPLVFLSYSHKDETWKERLRPQLRALENIGRLTVWDDRRIDLGGDWYDEIEAAVDSADVAICLISPDYLASDFCVKEEIPHLLDRRRRHGMSLLPVLIRPCAWELVEWLAPLQMHPRDGRSIKEDFAGREDGVFADIAREVVRLTSSRQTQGHIVISPLPSRSVDSPKQVSLQRLPFTGAELFGRAAELRELDEAWSAPSVRLVSLVAWGGVGKSTLVNKWVQRLEAENFRGAESVFAWSFYSQGTGERVTSADVFMTNALRWFGDSAPTVGSPWERGARLAALARRQRSLIILDGLEPLQSRLDGERGTIKDPALSTFILELARAFDGLCLITTREPVGALEDLPGARKIDLELLSPEAGRALLRVSGVRGADAELEQAARDFGQHALALTLLASFIRQQPGRHIRSAGELAPADPSDAPGLHARRVLRAFEEWLGPGPELSVLRLLGFFDRPASDSLLGELRAQPVIRGLTESVVGLSELGWERVLARLQELRLVSRHSAVPEPELDAHPILREHFGDMLRRELPNAWTRGNARLYRHLVREGRKFSVTLEQLEPMYMAVAFGCAAGLHSEALDSVFHRRIQREDESHSSNYFSAHSANLASLSAFFAERWVSPISGLSIRERSYVLNEAGLALRALGRLTEAKYALRGALDADCARSNWRDAAIACGNLAEVYVLLGELPAALETADAGLAYAERGGHPDQDMNLWAMRGDVLHQLGRVSDANGAFLRALQQERAFEGERGRLRSVAALRYGDLLLAQNKLRAAAAVEVRSRERVTQSSTPFALGLLNLAKGRVVLARARAVPVDTTRLRREAASYLDLAVADFRRAMTHHYLPRALIARAEAQFACGDSQGAGSDLEEALAIAQRGRMALYEIDCHIALARLAFARGVPADSADHILAASAGVNSSSYARRSAELKVLWTMAP